MRAWMLGMGPFPTNVKALGEGNDSPVDCSTRGLHSRNTIMRIEHLVEEEG